MLCNPVTSLTWICRWEADSDDDVFSLFSMGNLIREDVSPLKQWVGAVTSICAVTLIPSQVCFGWWCHLHGAAYETGGCCSLWELG